MTIERMINNVVNKYGKNSMEYFKFMRLIEYAKIKKHWIANSFLIGYYKGLMKEE